MGKNVVIIGSTGSIGIATLDVISKSSSLFKVCGLTCNQNIELLISQIKKFNPDFVSVYSSTAYEKLIDKLKKLKINIPVFCGEEGNIKAATYKKADIVVISVVGMIGLLPTLAAIDKQKRVCIANKESIVCAGSIIMNEAKKKKVKIIPIDSEHSAIFQLLENIERKQLKKIILTASGGPFRTFSYDELKNVTLESALKHPIWQMGSKITIDSATLMNKGLEVIEAMNLFNLSLDEISVIIHPQSIIHSMIELKDGSILAQLSKPDMRIPISYALSYPKRHSIDFIKPLDFIKVGALTFEEPDLKKFPCLKLAFLAAKLGGIMPTVLNAANEIAVKKFLDSKIQFLDIYKNILKTINIYKKNYNKTPSLEDIIKIDSEIRNKQ